MRAFTIHVNDVVGVAGFAIAGMHVDILVTGIPPGGAQVEGGGAVSRTLLQNIEILSAGQNYQKDAEGKPVLVQVVNLLVSPAQAEIMSLAADQKIQLVLRNPADRDNVETNGAVTASLFDGMSRSPRGAHPAPAAPRPVAPRPALPPAPEPPSRVTIEVFSGAHRSETTFMQPQTARAPVAAPAQQPAPQSAVQPVTPGSPNQ
jgi:pilus assembly protein CpaB